MMEPSEGGADNTNKNLLSPMMSAPTPTLEAMCPEVIRHIVQFLDYRGKKMLKGVSSTLKKRVEGCGDKLVHYWKFYAQFTTPRMIKFADAVETVLGFEVLDATDNGIEYLVNKHPEILMFRHWNKLTPSGLNPILSLPSLSSLIIGEIILDNQFKIYSNQLQTLDLSCINGTAINNVWFSQTLKQIGSTIKSLKLSNLSISGEFIEFNGTLPYLKNLRLSRCEQLSNKGLVWILQLCGSTLRSLDVSETNITGEKLAEFKGTLPCLENLWLNWCNKLSDNGFWQILQLCGSTLRSLDVSGTNITGENFAEFNGTLPCLEALGFSMCGQLSNKGLVKILQLCGSTLRSLDVSYTNITANFAEFNVTLPCLEIHCEELSDLDS